MSHLGSLFTQVCLLSIVDTTRFVLPIRSDMAFKNNAFLTESFERVINSFYEEAGDTNPTPAPIENSAEISAAAQDIVQHYQTSSLESRRVTSPKKSNEDKKKGTSDASLEGKSADESSSLLPANKSTGCLKVRERVTVPYYARSSPVIVHQPTSSFSSTVGQPKGNQSEGRPTEIEQLDASQTEATGVVPPRPEVPPQLPVRRMVSPPHAITGVGPQQPAVTPVRSQQLEGVLVRSPQPKEVLVRSPQPKEVLVRSPQPIGIPSRSPQPFVIPTGSPQPIEIPAGSQQPIGIATGSAQPVGIPARSPHLKGVTSGSPHNKGVPCGSPHPKGALAGSPQPIRVPVDSPQPRRTLFELPHPNVKQEKEKSDVDEKAEIPTGHKFHESCNRPSITKAFAEAVLEASSIEDTHNTRNNVYLLTRNPSHSFDFEWCLTNFSSYAQNVRSPVFSTGDCPVTWQASVSLNRLNGYLDFYFEMLSDCEDCVNASFKLGIYNTKGEIYMKSAKCSDFDEKTRKHMCFKTSIPPIETDCKFIQPFKVYDDELIIKGCITCTGCCISTIRLGKPKLKI